MDLFGQMPPPRPIAKDFPAPRDAVAEEKAQLCFELSRLLQRVPMSVRGGSIQLTHQYVAAVTAAKKVAASKSVSRQQLQSAINSLSGFEDLAC